MSSSQSAEQPVIDSCKVDVQQKNKASNQDPVAGPALQFALFHNQPIRALIITPALAIFPLVVQ
jgi:hypothetical protein